MGRTPRRVGGRRPAGARGSTPRGREAVLSARRRPARRRGRAGRETYDYKGNGTTPLFAALEVATGRITADACYPKHRHQEFLKFLKKTAAAHPGVELHVVCDNYATHKHPAVK